MTNNLLNEIRHRLAEEKAFIVNGKGKWPGPHYITDDSWLKAHSRISVYESLLHYAEGLNSKEVP